jgi:hypothetical protein
MGSILRIEASVHGSPHCHDRLEEDATMMSSARIVRGWLHHRDNPGERPVPATAADMRSATQNVNHCP